MTFAAVIVCTFALYGLLALVFQLAGRRPIRNEPLYGGVVDTSAAPSLGYLPPEVRRVEQRVLAARATA